MSISFLNQLSAENVNDDFGYAMASSGNILIVGTPGYPHPSFGNDCGAVFVYKTSDNGTSWTQVQKIEMPNSNGFNRFGASVDIDGNFIIIGAPSVDGNNNQKEGKVFIYKTIDNGSTWNLVATFSRDTSDILSQHKSLFGFDVSIKGNYACVGSPAESFTEFFVGATNKYYGKREGRLYTYRTTDGGDTWSLTQKIREPNPPTTTQDFAKSVALNGNYMAVYSHNERKGEINVYNTSDDGSSWTLLNTIQASDALTNDYLGAAPDSKALLFKDNYIVANACRRQINPSDTNTRYGKVFIFKTTDNWANYSEASIIGDEHDGRFGGSVSLSGNFLMIGAQYHGHGAHNNTKRQGRAYIYSTNDSGSTWSKEQELPISTSLSDKENFGHSVTLQGQYAVAGAPHLLGTEGGGRVLTYQMPGPTYSNEEQAVITSIGNANDLDTLKAVNFGTVSAGKGTTDATTRGRLKSLIEGATNADNKRARRRSILKLLFAQDTSVTRMVVPKDDLTLSANFTKTNAVVVKAGETFDIADLTSTEGFYAVLDDTEDVNIKLQNVTVKFTRDDAGNQEQYLISMVVGAFGDMTINTDDVTGGNFSESNTSGYLVPDDVVVLDGRKITIGSVEDGGNSGSGGDPYIFPIKSCVPLKLPNKSACYRMFEQGNNFVNVEVDRATMDHQHRMREYALRKTPVIHTVVCDGFFYQKAHISAEGHKLTVDYMTKNVTSDEESLQFFDIKQGKKHFDCGEFAEDAQCFTISWKTADNKKISTEVLFFQNPHMENGINVIPTTLKNSTGLIVENFKPKLMQIPSLTTESYGKLWRRLSKSSKKHQNMNIKGKNEKWHFN